LRGVTVGSTLALVAFFAGIQRIGGIHAGTYACAVNFAICWWGIRGREPGTGSREPV
jgi:hypothetical protein